MLKKIIKFTAKFGIEIVLGFMMTAYSVFFSYFSILRLLSFKSYYYDLGIMGQVVYNTSKGRFLELTNPHLLTNTSRLAIHFDPILALFAPLYWIWNSPEILLIIQSIILSLGALGIYLIAKKRLSKNISLYISLIYLLSPLLHYVNMFDFHGVALSITFLIFAFYFLTQKSKKHFEIGLLFVFLTWLTKENTFLITFMLGLYISLKTRRKKEGVLLSLFSVLLFILVVFVVIPYFNHGSHFASHYYSPSLRENLRRFFSFSTLDYLNEILVYTLYFPLIAWPEFLISLPQILLNVLSKNSLMRVVYFHYISLIIPFTFVGLIYSFDKLFYLLREKNRQRKYVVTLLLLALFFITLNASRKQVKKYLNYRTYSNEMSVIHQLQKQYIDDNIKLCTTPQIAPFFINHRFFYNFLFDPAYQNVGIKKDDIIKQQDKYRKADVVIIAKWEANGNELSKKVYKMLRQDKKYRLVFSKLDIEVYKKI